MIYYTIYGTQDNKNVTLRNRMLPLGASLAESTDEEGLKIMCELFEVDYNDGPFLQLYDSEIGADPETSPRYKGETMNYEQAMAWLDTLEEYAQ